MNDRRSSRLVSMAAVTLALAALGLGGLVAGGWTRPALAQPHGHGESHDSHMMGEGHHVHVPIPKEYAGVKAPASVWTDAKSLARGKEIFVARCVLCHGERGDGKGPGSTGLPLKPADLTDAHMVAMMPASYWFWRVSEGGQVEPFRSKGSAMPAWKQELSGHDRWAVIAYARTLSGLKGAPGPMRHSGMSGGKMDMGCDKAMNPGCGQMGHGH